MTDWRRLTGAKSGVFCKQMNRLIVAGFIGLTCAMALSAQAPAPAAPRPRSAAPAVPASPAVAKTAVAEAPALDATAERDLLNRYCVSCHSERAKAAGMDSARKIALDSVDLTDVHPHAEKLELVVRKLRAGMMPPAGARRPEPAVYKAMTAWLENELDRTATPYTPPPGLHRLNRTEYANAIRDLLDLDIDPAKYLPSDDSTARLRQHRRHAGHFVDARRGVRVGGGEDQPAGDRRSRRRRRWSCTGRRRTRRRTTTSKGCRSARAAGCSSSTSSRPTASTRSR